MGKQWKVTHFISSGSHITADGDCSHEIKTLAPWKTSCDQPRQHIEKQSHYFANKGPSSQSYGFSSSHVWMWEWAIKKAEHQRIDALELRCWKRLLRILPCKEIKPVHPNGDQSWIFIGRTDGWSWNSNTLATWCEELTHWKRPWCWERLKVGGEGGDREGDGWMTSLTWWTWVWASSRSWWWTGRPGVLQFLGLQRDTTERLNWTE